MPRPQGAPAQPSTARRVVFHNNIDVCTTALCDRMLLGEKEIVSPAVPTIAQEDVVVQWVADSGAETLIGEVSVRDKDMSITTYGGHSFVVRK